MFVNLIIMKPFRVATGCWLSGDSHTQYGSHSY